MSLIVGTAVAGGGTADYQISRSLRFNFADSAYLNRTLGTSNRRTFTFSTWVKRSSLGAGDNQTLFGCLNTVSGVNQQFAIQLLANETLMVYHFNTVDGTYFYYPTLAVFRDPSAWYHIVVGIDTTQATSTNRCKLYVNGVEQALNSPNNFTQNLDLFVNSGLSTGIGAQVGTGTSNLRYLGGYMSEVYFIDGQQLTPSSFGKTIQTQAYGSRLITQAHTALMVLNYRLQTIQVLLAATLGKDTSGNGNNWTPNNFSVTAGAGNDSLVDTPTNYGTDTGIGGSVRGNYATLNPIDEPSSYASVGTPVNGNLDFSVTNDAAAGATIAVSSGKWYWEMTVVSGHTAGANTVWAAIASSTPSSVNKLPYQSGSGGRAYATTGLKFNENSSSSYGNTYTNGDIIGCALDLDNGKVYWSKNGTFQASGDPVAGTNAAFTGLTGTWLPVASSNTPLTTFNFGQRAFAYTAPSGFKALCTQNLPTPTIGATSTTQANDYFNAVLWTGANTSAGNSVTGVGFSPDFVWAKIRSQGYANLLYDRLRGTGGTAELSSNETSAEGGTTASERGYLNSFDSDGFSSVVGTNGDNLYFNQTSQTYVAWNWKANGAGVTNTAGSITSTVSANTTSGFSIVTYTGNGSAGATVGHGLGVVPNMIIVKNRGAVTDWLIYHTSLGATKSIAFDTAAAITSSTRWNDTAPSSTLITLGTSSGVNGSTNTYVAYAFAPVAGYSAFGSYTGNGSSDGPFVYTGFRPAYVMIKYSSGTADWIVLDKSRPGYNVIGGNLYPSGSYAEDTQTKLDFTSNGFKIRADGSNANVNVSSGTYIYAAFAESPFKYALAR
jgi:hypothetical protein